MMLQLNDCEWKEFNIREIFPFVKRGKRLKTADHVDGDIPYVSSSAMDNGVDAFIGANRFTRATIRRAVSVSPHFSASSTVPIRL